MGFSASAFLDLVSKVISLFTPFYLAEPILDPFTPFNKRRELTSKLETVLDTKPTFFESLMPALEAPVLALDFSNKAASSGNASMSFGYVDETKFQDPLAQVPIDKSTNRWTANDIRFSVEDYPMGETANLVLGAL